jgi:hypothetical protein
MIGSSVDSCHTKKELILKSKYFQSIVIYTVGDIRVAGSTIMGRPSF